MLGTDAFMFIPFFKLINFIFYSLFLKNSFLVISDGKESACNVEDPGLIPGLGRFLGEGLGNPLQYACLENPMDRGAWGLWSMGLQRVGYH